MKKNNFFIFLTLVIIIFSVNNGYSQDTEYENSNSSCQTLLEHAKKYHREALFSKAIENYINVKECVGNETYSALYVEACVGLGNIYNDIYDTYEAVNQFKEGINHQIIFKANDPIPQMYVRDGLGKTLINEGKFEQAITLIDLSVKMSSLVDDKQFKIESLNNLIYLLALKDNLKDANEHLLALENLTQDTDVSKKMETLIEVSKLGIELSKDLNGVKSEIVNFERDNSHDFNTTAKERILRLKHQIDLRESDKNKCIESYNIWDNFRDSIQIDFYKNLKDSLQLRSQKRVVDEELHRLRIQERLNQTEVSYKNKNILYLIILLLALIAIIVFIYYFFNRLKKQKATIESLQKELHHRVKNNLSIIDTFIEVAKEEFNEIRFTTKLSELQNRIDSINEVHQQLYLKEDITNLNLKKYIDKLSNNITASFSNHEIEIVNNINNSLTIKADKSFSIGLVINEFITNSFKYAFENKSGKVSINVVENKNSYAVTLKDNGKGLPKDFNIEESETFGLRIIKLLSKQLNGTFELINNNGVILNITFPK